MGHFLFSQMVNFQCWMASRRDFWPSNYGQSGTDCLPPHVGHSDQVPYIVTWRGLINREGGPYPWVKTFLSPQDPSAYVLATRTGDPSRVREAKAKPQVFQRGTPQELFSSPYLAQPASSASAGPNFLLQALEQVHRNPCSSDSGPKSLAHSTQSQRGGPWCGRIICILLQSCFK